MDVGNQLIDNIKALLDTLKGTDQPMAEVYDSPTFKSVKYPYCFVSDSGIDSDFQDQQLNERMYAYKVWVFNEYDVDNARTSRRALRTAVDAILNKIDQQESPDSAREIAYGLANLYTVMAVMATIGETVYDEEEKMIGQVVTIRVKVTVDITSALIEGPSGIVDPGHAYIADAANYYTSSQVDTLLAGYSLTTHTHDDRYYTETEINTLFDSYYTAAEVNTLLSGYSLTTHNHDADYVNIAGDSMTGSLTIRGTANANILSLRNQDNVTVFNVGSYDGDVTIYQALTVNENGGDQDTRIEGDTDTNLILVDANVDRVGIGTNAPQTKLDVNGSLTMRGSITTTSNGNLSLVPNGTGYTIIGDAGTTSHSFNTNDDLLVSGRLEVNGVIWFDAAVQINVPTDSPWGLLLFNESNSERATLNANYAYDQFVFGLSASVGRQLILCDNGPYVRDFDHAAQTNPTLYIHDASDPDVSNNKWGSVNHDGVGLAITTGVAVGTGSTPATIDNYISFRPRGTQSVLMNGNGDFILTSASPLISTDLNKRLDIIPNGTGYTRIGNTAATSHSFATGNDLMVCGKFEVDGEAFFDGNITGTTSTVVTAKTFSAYGGDAGFKLTNTNDSTTAHGFFKITYDGMQFGYSGDAFDRYDSAIYVGRAFAYGDTIVATIAKTDIVAVSDLRNILDDGSGNMKIAGSLTMIGSITTASNANFSIVPNGTGYTIIGDAGTTSHTFNTNDDLLVSGRLEVDGAAFIDGVDPSLTIDSTVNYGTVSLIFNESATTGMFRLHARSSMDQAALALYAASGRQFIITGDIDYQDFDHAVQTNPTLYIHSAIAPDTDNTQWLSLAHDQTDSVITSGKGDLKLDATVNVTGNIEIDGTQVITNRIIDARIDDAPNSGDATTDGIIAAIQSIIQTHGLAAAA